MTADVFADPAGQARFHDELARSHYQAGRLEQALREFFLEQRISPNPRIAFNIALCFEGLARKEEAFQYLSEYLGSDDRDPERRAYAERAVEKLKKTLALVRVHSAPAGAAIYVDRRELGSYGTTPRVIALTPGEHEVWAELEGYRTANGKVVAHRAQEVVLELAPVRIVGRLDVTTTVAGQVAVRSGSGETVGQGAAPLTLSVPPGAYEVTVTAAGHVPWSGIARVEADKTASVTAAPQLAPAPTGSITVTSNVPGALVELNGEPAGFSPAVLPNVKVGENRLRVASADLVPWSGKVDVGADERSWLTVSLEEPPEERIAPVTWVAGGLSVAALIAAGVLTALAASAHSDFEAAPVDKDRNAIRERGETLNVAADVSWITAGVTGAAAIALYFTTGEVKGRPSSASLTRSER